MSYFAFQQVGAFQIRFDYQKSPYIFSNGNCLKICTESYTIL